MTSLSVISTIAHLVVMAAIVERVGCLPPSHNHGDVKMGVSDDLCDNGQWRLWVDLDNSTDYAYRCQRPAELQIPTIKSTPKISCLNNEDIPPPIHTCMTESIRYYDQPPRGGAHRPLWPVYGEYSYVPPQRWVHSIEHGGVVFLFHPCADPDEIRILKTVAKSCLRRHVITPYRHLSLIQPLAIVTYGCRLTMSRVDVGVSKKFIQENALNPDRASEVGVWQDGQYNYGLIEPAAVVPGSDIEDSIVCPVNVHVAHLIEENMLTT